MGREFSQAAMQRGEIPEAIDEYRVTQDVSIVDLLVETGLLKSKSDARRQIEGGGVRYDGEKVTDVLARVTPDQLPAVLQYGKRRFVRLVKG
jgi:tyrosyl-tRNA synthetase